MRQFREKTEKKRTFRQFSTCGKLFVETASNSFATESRKNRKFLGKSKRFDMFFPKNNRLLLGKIYFDIKRQMCRLGKKFMEITENRGGSGCVLLSSAKEMALYLTKALKSVTLYIILGKCILQEKRMFLCREQTRHFARFFTESRKAA